jgi:peptide chain release factor 3
VGVVGNLQLDVLKSRLRNEYELDADLEPSPYDTARWVTGGSADLEKLTATYRNQMATDRDGAPVFLAKSAWELGYVTDKLPKLRFAKTRERHDVHAES